MVNSDIPNFPARSRRIIERLLSQLHGSFFDCMYLRKHSSSSSSDSSYSTQAPMDQTKSIQASICCSLLCVFGVALLLSFTIIAPTEVALTRNWLFNTVDKTVLTEPGLTFVGPLNIVMKYPKTIQSVSFDGNDIIHGRTSDGLPLFLGLTWQYRLHPDGIYNMYHTYELTHGDYVRLFNLLAIHIITETANKFSAYQFFTVKQHIAETMATALNTYLHEHFNATVEALQINEDRLPQIFTTQILETSCKRQNIRRTVKVLAAKKVDFQTARIIARAQANMTINRAYGSRNHIIQNAHADAMIINSYIEAEIESYSKVNEELKLSPEDLLSYIWYDSVAGGSVEGAASATEPVALLLGVNPGTYLAH